MLEDIPLWVLHLSRGLLYPSTSWIHLWSPIKILHQHGSVDLRSRFFSMRCVRPWDALPGNIVALNVLKAFKSTTLMVRNCMNLQNPKKMLSATILLHLIIYFWNYTMKFFSGYTFQSSFCYFLVWLLVFWLTAMPILPELPFSTLICLCQELRVANQVSKLPVPGIELWPIDL